MQIKQRRKEKMMIGNDGENYNFTLLTSLFFCDEENKGDGTK